MKTLMKQWLALLLVAGMLLGSGGLSTHAAQPPAEAASQVQTEAPAAEDSTPPDDSDASDTAAEDLPDDTAEDPQPDADGDPADASDPESQPGGGDAEPAPESTPPQEAPADDAAPADSSPSDSTEPPAASDDPDVVPEETPVEAEEAGEGDGADALTGLDALLALAATDGAEAARLLNLYPDGDAHQAALKDLLVFYYGAAEPSAQQPHFLAALDGRATALAADFAAAAQERATHPDTLGFMPGTVLVQFRSYLSEARAEVTTEELDGSLEAVLLDIDHRLTTVVDIPLWQTVAQAVESFSADSNVVYAEPDYVLHIEAEADSSEQTAPFAPATPQNNDTATPEAGETPNDPGAQWHHAKINTLDAWALLPDKGAGNEVIVAVIDIMPDTHHEDLDDVFLHEHTKSFNATGLTTTRAPEGPSKETTPSDTGETTYTGHSDHATMVAGIIGAVANNDKGGYGVAAGRVRMMALDATAIETVVTDPKIPVDGEPYTTTKTYGATTASMAKAIDYARLNGAQVVNMSMGGTSSIVSETLTTAMTAAVAEGMVMVSSAGNKLSTDTAAVDDATYTGTNHHYPSDYDNVLGVINLTDTTYTTGTGTNPRATSSYYGWAKNLSAPGSSIYSCSSQNINKYRANSGTSFASPMVAGVAALVKYANPALTTQQVYDILCATAIDVHLEGRDRHTGYGCVNAEAAVRMALATLPAESLTADDGYGQVSLSWAAVPGADGYQVYAQAPGGSMILLDTLEATDTGYTHQNLTVAGDYHYEVTTLAHLTRQNVVDKKLLYTDDEADLANITREAVTIESAAATATITVVVPATGVALSPTSITLAPGRTTTLAATVAPPTASDKTVAWHSSHPAFATVDDTGLVTALADGMTTITATTNDGGHEATCTVTVESIPVSGVALDITSRAIPLGKTLQLTATVSPADATDPGVRWASSHPDIASVDDTGLVTTLAVGDATITVTTNDGGFEAGCALTVEPVPVAGVSLLPASATLAPGGTLPLTPTVNPANATNQAAHWASSHPDIAGVDTNGLVTAHAAGSATITVTMADGGFEASCVVTVATPVTGLILDITRHTLPRHQTVQLTATVSPADATDPGVTWRSSNPAVATVNASGLVSARADGTATITATTTDGGFEAGCTVTVVTPVTGLRLDMPSLTLEPGRQFPLAATVTPSDATNPTVTWHSSHPAVATVADGVITTLAAGSATITATTVDGGFSASCAVQVVAPVTTVQLPQSSLNLVDGKSLTLPAAALTTDGSQAALSWSSSDESVATVGPDGRIVGVGTGTAVITVAAENGKATSLTVTVVKKAKKVTAVSASVPASMTAGTQRAITGKYAPSGATGVKISYKSSKSSVLAVSSAGVLTARKAGTATITVKAGSVSKKYTVTVKAPAATALKLSKTSATIKKGRTVKLRVSVAPSYADKTVTWKSSNKKVATVSSSGVVKGMKKGQATITVTAKKGKKKATCVVTVK